MAMKIHNQLAKLISNYCYSKGILMMNTQGAPQIAPLTVFPTIIHPDQIGQLAEAQLLWADMIHNLSIDRGFINQILGPYRASDHFVDSLLKVYKNAPEDKYGANILRVDYLYDILLKQYQLVEYNTIACSFGSLGYKVAKMHEYIMKMHEITPKVSGHCTNVSFDSHTAKLFCHSIDQIKNTGEERCMVLVVEKNERNVFDQQSLALECLDAHGILPYRLTFDEILHNTRTVNGNIYYNNKRIHLFYLRTGYNPGDYVNDDAYKARSIIENSNALCCPTLSFHLTTFKAFQSYIYSNISTMYGGKYKKLEKLMPAMLPLSSVSKEQLKHVYSNPNQYVLKSHREGGGNNYYGKNIPTFLDTHKYENMFLMNKINTQIGNNFLFRNGAIAPAKTISEFSIFSGYRSSEGQMHAFQDLGYLLRTKLAESGEGGVAAGHAVIDSPYFLKSTMEQALQVLNIPVVYPMAELPISFNIKEN